MSLNNPTNATQIHAIHEDDNPRGMIAALIALYGQQRLINEANIELVAANVLAHPKFGPHVSITCKHLTGGNAGALSTRFVVIPNTPYTVPMQSVRFMEFNNEYDIRTYTPGQVAIIAMDAVHFLINGDLPDLDD